MMPPLPPSVQLPLPQEMEAAAVAWSADLFGCPVFCIKSITDIVDGDRPAQVGRVVGLAAEIFC